MAIKFVGGLECEKNGEEFYRIIIQTVKEKAPYGKVLLMSTEKDFEKIGCETVKRLKCAGNKTVVWISSEEFKLSVENACGLFCAPEDTRVIISLSDRLTQLKKYFAEIRRVPCLSVSDGEISHHLNNTVFIENGENVDRMKTRVDDTVIIKRNISLASVYALTVRYKFGLFDYYAKSHFTGCAFDAASVRKAKSLLDLCEDALVEKRDTRGVNIALDFLVSACDNYQELFDENFITVIEAVNGYAPEKTPSFISLALDFFGDRLSSGESFAAPDYVWRAEKVAAFWKVNELETLKCLKEQKERINPDITKQFEFAFKQTRKYIQDALKTYCALGGTKQTLTEQDLLTLKLSGDTPYGINLMSVYREIFSA